MGKIKKLKICFVTTSFGEEILDLANILSLVHEVHIIYINYPSMDEYIKKEISTNCHLHGIKYNYKGGALAQTSTIGAVIYTPLFIKFILEIRRVVKIYNVDIIHAFWALPSGFLAAICRGKIPLVTTLEGSDIKIFGKKLLLKSLAKYTLRRSTKIVALSNDLKHESVTLGAKSDKIQVIPGGVDTDKFRQGDKAKLRAELGLPEGPIVLFIGGLIELKGVDKLIRVSSSLSRDFDLNLLIVGDGVERANLENLAKSMELEKITFTGWLPHNNVPSYTAASDILVLPSRSEGLPNCIQEAMMCGVPAVASNVGGIPDLIKSGENGYIFEKEAELEGYLREMLSSSELMATMSAKALHYAQEHFALDKLAEQVEELYNSILYTPASNKEQID